MLKSGLRFLQRISHSRLGLALASVHLCLVIYSFGLKEAVPRECHDRPNYAGESFITGRTVHLHYESVILKALLLLDLPGAALALPGDFLFWLLRYLLPEMCVTTESWIAAAILLVTTSVQWCCIGYWIERWWRIRRPSGWKTT